MVLASASTSVKFHELPSGNVIHNYQPNTQIAGLIQSISWSKDGNWLALVPHCGHTEIISVKDKLKLIHTITCIEEPTCASFQTTTKKNIAIGTKSGETLIYDIKTKTIKKRFSRATSAVNKVEFTIQDVHVIATCENGEAYVYSNVHNNLSGTFKVPRSQSISTLKTHPIKKKYIAAGSNEGVVVVWDIYSNKNKFFIGSHKASVTSVAFSPINLDLLVSTGLDRQFCVYDISKWKCIGSIFVENSMTAVDFSPDGKSIVMASQKGKIHVYDANNFQQPIYTFIAHNGSIQHLAFKKCEELETSFTFSSDQVTQNKSDSERNNESFSVSMMLTDDAKSVASSQNSTIEEDSFMAAIGLDNKNNESEQIYELTQNPIDINKKLLTHTFTPTTSLKNTCNSTPNMLPINEIAPTISPIITTENITNMNQNDKSLGIIDRNITKEELKNSLEEFKNQIIYYCHTKFAESRRLTLSLMMAMVKESIKNEDNFNNLRTTSEVPENINQLYQENLILKERILLLEEELKLAKIN